MMQHNSQMCGQLVAKIPDIVQKLYRFNEEKSTQSIQGNCQLFMLLKEDNGFYFKVLSVIVSIKDNYAYVNRNQMNVKGCISILQYQRSSIRCGFPPQMQKVLSSINVLILFHYRCLH